MKTISPSKPGLALRGLALCVLALGGLLLPLLSPWANALPPTVRWVLDLVVHWQPLIGLTFAVGVVLLAIAYGSPLALVLLALCALPVLTSASYQSTLQPSGAPALTIVTFNVHLDNVQPQRVLDWLAEVDADLVVLQEVSPSFAKVLESSDQFEHKLLLPRDDPFGLALLSRLPLKDTRVRPILAGSLPAIEAKVLYRGQEVRLAAAHPMPPIAAQYVAERDTSLAREAQAMAGAPGLLIGDFNATVWSSAFPPLRELGWTTASPITGTWPAAAPSVFRIGLDHVLVSKGWAVRSRELGPRLHSDHLPVVVRLELLELATR